MDLNMTEQELEIIKNYKAEKYSIINQQLTDDVESDINLMSSGNVVDYSRENVIQNLELIKKVYEIMLKCFNNHEAWEFFRGTNIAEIEKINQNPNINKFLAMTKDKQEATEKYSSNWSRPVCMKCTSTKRNTIYY